MASAYETGDASEEEYDPSLAYKLLEEDFQQIIEELDRHDKLGHFSAEFHRLMEALQKSHNKERELIDKNKTLHTQISANAAKVAAALKLSQADKETIEKLKQEIDSAWHMVDAAHTREQLAQESLDTLRLQVQKLQTEIEASKKLGADQEQEAGALAKNKEALARERERLMMEMTTAKERLAHALIYQTELETKNDVADERISELMIELEAQKNEISKEKRFKEKLEDEVKELKDNLSAKELEILGQTGQINQNQKNLLKLENMLREQKANNEKLTKELQEMANSQKAVKADYDQQVLNVEKLTQDMHNKKKDLQEKEDLLARYRAGEVKQEKLKEALTKKIATLEDQKSSVLGDKNKLVTTIVSLEKELIDAKKQMSIDRKVVDALNREKDVITKAAQKAAAYTHEQQRLIGLQELHKKKLQEELSDQREIVARQKAELTTLQQEKEKLTVENIRLNTEIEKYVEDLKFKQSEVYDCQKRIFDADAKMKLHLQIYDQVRTERNQLSKGLVEASDEMTELKHKLKVKSYQVEQLKEDITTKESQLIKEEFALQKITKEKEGIRLELQKSNSELRECKERITLLTQEEKRLQKVIHEADNDRTRLNKELTQVSNERDILGTQLVRRNDELSLLYEKIKILQCTLHKGEAQYDQRMEDIRLLKIEIKRLRQEKAMLARSMNNLSDLRQEIFHLERDFTRERLKCRALEEELQNPLNVHRWRKLEGSDPATYELIQKIQILQKRLIASSEEAIKRENQLKESERLYLNLRQLLDKQPGPETVEKLHKTQQALRERGVKMKCLVAELTMYENQISEYKYDLEQVNAELTEMKKKYFGLKRREQKVKEKETEINRDKSFLPILEPITTSKSKFVGGGFNIAPPCLGRVPSISTHA